MSFLGMGPLELLVIFLLAFVILGPEKMIDTARWMGKTVGELRKMASELPRLSEEDFQPRPITRNTNQAVKDSEEAEPPIEGEGADAVVSETESDEDGPVDFRSASRAAKAEAETTQDSDAPTGEQRA